MKTKHQLRVPSSTFSKFGIMTLIVIIMGCHKEDPELSQSGQPVDYPTVTDVQSVVDDDDYKDLTQEEFDDFVNGIIDEDWGLTISFNQGMYLTEAVSNLRLSSIDQFEYISEVQTEQFELEVAITFEEGVRYVSAAELMAFNEEIYDEVDMRLQNMSFPTSGNDELKFIMSVDIVWNEDFDTNGIQPASIFMTAGKESAISAASCTHDYPWYAVKPGGCGNNPSGIQFNAINAMEFFLNHTGCNESYYNATNCIGSGTNRTYFDMQTIWHITGGDYPGDLWYAGSYDHCMSTAELDTYTAGAEHASLGEQPYVSASPSSPKKDILNYDLDLDVFTGGCTSCWLHTLDVTYGRCMLVTPDNFTSTTVQYHD